MIHVLSGKNAYLRTQKLRTLVHEFSQLHGMDWVERVAGENVTLADLPSLLQGGSLFSSHRMVIIRDLSVNKDAAEKLLEMLENIPEEVELVLVEPQLDKRSSFYKKLKVLPGFIEFEEPKEPELTRWVEQYIKDSGGSIGSAAIRQLIEYVGLDQQRLANEVDKLLAYDPVVSPETVELLVERRPQSTVFHLLEQALGGQAEKARATLGALESAFEDPYQVANLLIWQVQAVAVVKSAGSRSDGDIAKSAKLNPYVVSKTRRLARVMSQNQLNIVIDRVASMDIKLKSTSVQPWRLLEATFASFADN